MPARHACWPEDLPGRGGATAGQVGGSSSARCAPLTSAAGSVSSPCALAGGCGTDDAWATLSPIGPTWPSRLNGERARAFTSGDRFLLVWEAMVVGGVAKVLQVGVLGICPRWFA